MPTRGPFRRHETWLRAALLATVVLSGAVHFGNGFVIDDRQVIVEGDVIHDLANLPAAWTSRTMFVSSRDDGSIDSVDTYRPVSVTTFFLDATWSGRRPFGYHLTNLALHALCTMLVLEVGQRRLALSPQSAAISAFFFALHPWLVEAHVWINGRSDPLALAAVLGATLVQGASGRQEVRALGVALLVLLSLLAKETALMLVPVLALAPIGDGETRARPSVAVVLNRGAPLVLAASAYLVVRAFVLEGVRVGTATRLFDALAALPVLLVDGLGRAIVPVAPHLRSLRDEHALLGPAAPWIALGICALLAAGVFLGRREPMVPFGAAWFVAPLVPVAVIATVLWPGFGRYLYLPMPGLAWLLGLGVARLETTRARTAVRALTFLYGLGLALGFHRYATQFRDEETLLRASIAAAPDVGMGHGWLGNLLVREGRAAEAIPLLERAVALDPTTHLYLSRLGQAHLATGDYERSALVARVGIERFANRPEEASYHMLAVQSLTTPDAEAAAAHLHRCLVVWPRRSDCLEAAARIARDPAHREALRRRAASGPESVAAALRAILEETEPN